MHAHDELTTVVDRLNDGDLNAYNELLAVINDPTFCQDCADKLERILRHQDRRNPDHPSHRPRPRLPHHLGGRAVSRTVGHTTQRTAT